VFLFVIGGNFVLQNRLFGKQILTVVMSTNFRFITDAVAK
jgi:hypothetical protein